MNPYLNVPSKAPGKFRLGDRVRIVPTVHRLTGEIVEDRGIILAGNRRLYGVKVRFDEWNEVVLEFPEEELEAAEK